MRPPNDTPQMNRAGDARGIEHIVEVPNEHVEIGVGIE